MIKFRDRLLNNKEVENLFISRNGNPLTRAMVNKALGERKATWTRQIAWTNKSLGQSKSPGENRLGKVNHTGKTNHLGKVSPLNNVNLDEILSRRVMGMKALQNFMNPFYKKLLGKLYLENTK